MNNTWVIAIGNSEADGVKLMKAEGSVEQMKDLLLNIVKEDAENDEDMFDYGTEDVSEIETDFDAKTGEVSLLNAYNVFHSYHIDYTVQRLDAIEIRKLQD